ncbi:MAG TPA: UDP-N-acetylglucosamine--N-acetylmuramyl-(pentapeptide) pyrophosphoryl-undecaprenol N-acetylglucosamine transferase [Candidatus Andersenbacteria bacterium]|nr:UDP-N-acetylglucosamine--N-acetylmuramyl-(pentapeptide) pyrophosphoryl-undecaprenol N-acetylglucosamine transferase [Candidatus Andersenbacteria bacterium]
MRIVFTGGGTGGHIMPFESIIEAVRIQYTEKKSLLPAFTDPEELSLFFLGVVTPEGKEFFDRYQVATYDIPSGKVRRYISFLTITDILFQLPLGIIIALIRMWIIMPDVVVSKGGYGSIPTTVAAILYRIPILLHESDVTPGASNEFMMRFASAITLGFAVSREYLSQYSKKLFVTGTPTRTLISKDRKKDSKTSFGFPESEHVVLVMGGSQGAQQINDALIGSLPTLINDMAIIHITGEAHHAAMEKIAGEFLATSSRKTMYKSFPSLQGADMARALMAADSAVTRAGASSLAEIARLRIPSLIIPLASAANDHQRKNALAFEAAGAALVLDPNNVTTHLLSQGIERLISDQQLRTAIVKNIEALDFPHAALDIATLALELASGYLPSSK